MKTIIVPIDFSDQSFKALQYAGKLAATNKAKVIIFHNLAIIPGLVEKFTLGNQIFKILTQLEARLQDLIPLLRRESNFWYEAETYCCAGSFIQNLNDLVFEKKADLVVMDTKGADSTLERFLCATAVGYIKKAICPVLLVPQDTEPALPKRLAYVTEFEYDEKLNINQLVPFIQDYKPDVSLVNIRRSHDDDTTKDDQLFYDLEDQFPNERVFMTQLFTENFTEALDEFIQVHQIDLLTVPVPKLSFFEDLFNTSFAWALIHRATLPVLTLPDAPYRFSYKTDWKLKKVAS